MFILFASKKSLGPIRAVLEVNVRNLLSTGVWITLRPDLIDLLLLGHRDQKI